MHRIITSLSLAASLHGFDAITVLDGTMNTTSTDPVNNVEEITVDILFTVIDLDASTDDVGTKYVIFESGGNVNGIAVWLEVTEDPMGSKTLDLVFYQDRGPGGNSPALDTSYSLGISQFEGAEVVLRLDNDYSGTTDTSLLTLTDGNTTVTSGVQTLLGDMSDGVGGGNTGLGVINGNIAGRTETGFEYEDYPVAAEDEIVAYIYDTVSPTDPPPPTIPTPATFPIPEPSSCFLICLGAMSLLRRRRALRDFY